MPTETGCNPPNCLIIPPASGGCFSVVSYSQQPNCGGLSFDFPFDPTIPIPPGPAFAPYLCRTFWGFRLASGLCAQVLVQNGTSQGRPIVGQSTVTCPPGFTYDPIHEVCVLDGFIIIWPNGVPTPPPTPLPGSGCVPNCQNSFTGKKGVLSAPCFFLCDVAGADEQDCVNSCCVECAADPQVPRGLRDLVSGRKRSRFDFGRAPFELQHAIAPPAHIAPSGLGKFRLLNPSFRSHRPIGFG